jgi:uncharacterized protein (TIGR02145 family)
MLWVCTLISGALLTGCQKNDSNGGDTNTQVMDHDQNIYTPVTIGTQTWTLENLQTTTYLNGDSIPGTARDISAESAPKYQWAYDNNLSNVATYGRLYTWYAITDSRKICPAGWHVPTDLEWETLISFLGGDTAAGKLKEKGTLHWQAPNTNATNLSGFTALPGGYRTSDGQFASLHLSSYLWSTTLDADLAWGIRFHYNEAISQRWAFKKEAGVSVRCLKDGP